jgi:NTP pyrophosphatase (non-canonical NTP hydrolase)
MDANEYQRLVMRTAASPSSPAAAQRERLNNAALGICGEGGEVADLVKKWLYQGHDLDTARLEKELGDVTFYVALACEAVGLSLGDVKRGKIEKLQRRYPDGFSAERSRNRQE